ncbi:MAG: molybdopterin-dependent oxidoreductase, partial [Dehalococcoidia bacterium]|nr:molybdopterin-dependent oxidoreductase [Dehalococcoidia bacterium]
LVSNGGAYASTGPFVTRRAVAMCTGPYRIPNVHLVGKSVYTNTPFCGSFRGFGIPQVTFAIESQMDDLAQRLGLDPLELRLRNAFEPGSETATRQVLGESVGLKQTLEAVRSHYVEARRLAEGQQGTGEVRRGVGVASYWGAIGLEETTDYAEARLELQADGRLCLYTGSTDTGQGTHTILAQIVSEVMGLPMESIIVEGRDTAVTPDCFSGSASKQTMNSGNAVLQASRKLRDAILDIGARAVEQRAEDLYLADGFLLSRVDHDLRVPLEKVASWGREAGVPQEASAREEVPLPEFDPIDGHGVLTPCYTFATQVAEVEVNMRTGEVQVVRVVAAQ